MCKENIFQLNVHLPVCLFVYNHLKQFFSYPSAMINTNDRAANFNGTDQSHSNAIYENSVVNNNTCSIKDD